MKQNSKRIIGAVVLLLSSSLFFLLAYVGFQDRNINLNNYKKANNIIVEKGIGFHDAGKAGVSRCFYIRLKNIDEKFGVYRKSNNYQDLLYNLNVGDTVNVYYSNVNIEKDVNINLIQIERDNQIVLDKKEYEQKQSALIYIGLIAGISMIIFAILYYIINPDKK